MFQNELYRNIYRTVMQIPPGMVSTYGDIAQRVGNKNLARFVGNVLHKNPFEGTVPCHRVVNSAGKIALHFAFGSEEQQKRLEREGVTVTDGKIDLKRYRFDWMYERFPSSENPLSSDIFLFRGNKQNYIFDCGASESASDYLNNIDSKVVIISHFHQDHSTNARNLSCPIFGGKKTCEYIKKGTIVSEPIVIDDGLTLQISPFRTFHAKDSLCVNLNERYLFVGDALYGGRYGYNASMLLETIKAIEDCRTTFVVSSHTGCVQLKEVVLERLKNIYNRRKGNEPYIGVAPQFVHFNED